MSTLTTTTSTFGVQLAINAPSGKHYDVDFSLNVYRRQEQILYRSQTGPTEANLAFVSGDQPLSSNSVHIADRSSTVPANRITELDEPVKIESLSEYEVPTDKFVVTDVYKAADNANTSTPLFYKHVVSREHLPRVDEDDDTINDLFKLTDVEVLDINLVSLRIDDAKIDYDEGIVYSNLLSSFSQDTAEATVYYVRYSVKDEYDVITSYVELMNNVPVFREADFDDLDEELHIIDDGRKVYLIEEAEGALNVILPHIGNYSFQLLSDARIRLLPPPESDLSEPWYVSVSNGKFFTLINGSTYRFSIGEFLTQHWDPEVPFKRSTLEEAEFISDKLVKLRRSGINTDATLSGYVDLLVYDSDTTPVAAFTTESGKWGTVSPNGEVFEFWTNTNKLGIRSVDNRAGIVDLDGFKLRSDYKLYSSYTYEELAYEFTFADFNPMNNPDILTRVVSLYVDPDTEETNKTQTLYFTISDRSGKILKSNHPDWNDNYQMITMSDGFLHPAYHGESFPSYVNEPGQVLWQDHFTLLGSGLYLPLGDIYVAEHIHPSDLTTIDVRNRGGGVGEPVTQAATTLQSEVGWYWDIGFWDGTPYPGTAAYYIEVPVDVLEVGGGTFTSDQVRSIVDRHTAAGVYAIAKAYGIDPEISGVRPGDGYIEIGWRSYSA